MKTLFTVAYNGNASRFKNFEVEILAANEREAVEKVFSKYLNSDYFPQEDGNVLDCDGNLIAEKDDTTIYYDGGYFFVKN